MSEKAEVIAEAVAPVTPEVVQDPATPDTPETVDSEATPAAEKVVDKTFTQAELDEIVQKRINKFERKMERQRIEAETREKVRVEQQAKPVEAPDKPNAEDFTDYDQYIEALTDWKTDQKFAQREAEQARKQAEKSQQTEAERTNERQNELLENGERKYDDFEDVVKSDKTVYSRAAYLSILESDQSADIVYHLAKNPDEAKRISELPAYAQAKEIGKLEDKLLQKPKPKPSNAPEPITPIEGSKSFQKKLEDMSYAEMTERDRKRGARYLSR
jgi:hypothetical protein